MKEKEKMVNPHTGSKAGVEKKNIPYRDGCLPLVHKTLSLLMNGGSAH